MENQNQSQGNSHQDTLEVTVNYPAAAKPYHEQLPRSETVGQLKAAVLKAFNLVEGNVVYTLYFKKSPLENPSQTLGELAGTGKGLELKLSQQVTQG
ncbi:MAG: hypothetical protein NTY77_16005 [Elusimicrobia bacterium]|nr:hypothetical protein [Elusimicrobiota bacterium]